MFYNVFYLVLVGNVVVVILNYRFGFFGFFILNNLVVCGNYGIYD